jgi:thiamine transport system permease protein
MGAKVTESSPTHPSAAVAGDLNRLPRWFVPALAILPAVVVAVFYAWPLATVLGRGLSRSALVETLGDSVTWDVVWFTLWQALVSTALTVVLGLAPAYVIARFEFPGRRLLDSALVAVFVLPTVVIGAAVLAVLPESIERGVAAIVAAHVLFNLAVVVRIVGAVLSTLPRDREAAAATLGAAPRRVFREITLPAILPSVGAAAAIVFVFTFTSFGVVRVLGTVRNSTIEVEIWRQATRFGDIGSAAVLTVLQLAAIALLLVSTQRLQRRRNLPLGLTVRQQRRPPQPGGQRRFVLLTAIATSTVIAVPMVALIERSLRSGDGYSTGAWRSLGSAEIRPGIRIGLDPIGALFTSFRVMVVAVVIAVVVGALAALAIAAATSGGRLLDTALLLPIATSAVTIGFGILITFDEDPFDWRGSWWIVPIGHALVAIPFVVRAVLPVLRGVEVRRLEAAATLGASSLRAWREVIVPHLRRPLVVGAGIAAAISLGEFGATSFLSRSGQETMPIAIERLLGRTGTLVQGQGYALAVILAAATIAVVVLIDLGNSPAIGGRTGE